MGLVKNKVAPEDIPEAVQGNPARPDPRTELAAAESGRRRAAARVLADDPATLPLLCDHLEGEPSPSVRAVIITALIRHQSPEIAARLARFLRSDDASLRNAAIEALQQMPDAIAPHLRTLLADPDSDVRIFAVTILGALRHAEAPEWLAAVLRHEPHINVCAAAVDALAEVGGLEDISDLKALRARFAGQAFMVFAIDTAIRRIRGQ